MGKCLIHKEERITLGFVAHISNFTTVKEHSDQHLTRVVGQPGHSNWLTKVSRRDSVAIIKWKVSGKRPPSARSC